MYKIKLTNAFREEFQNLLKAYEPNRHIDQLKRYFSEDVLDIGEVLMYGLPYLPQILDAHGNKNLDLLEGFVPEVVGYYEILSCLSFLPETITDLCTDLSVYANGASIELSSDVYSFAPTEAIQKALA
jgi:hypothetical protein